MQSVLEKSPPRLLAGARISSIQGLRGLAACLVAAMHCLSSKGGLTDLSSPVQHQVTMAFCAVGGAGVDIFFVISGFIIVTLAERRVPGANRFGEAWRFLLRRFGRIYPLCWLTFAAAVAAASWYARGIAQYHTSIDVWELLLITTQMHVQPPAWTLAFEIWFYFGATVLMLLPPRFFAEALLIWAIMQAAFVMLHAALGFGPDLYMFTQTQVLDFFLGCAVAYLCARGVLATSQAVALLLIGVCLFSAGCLLCYVRLPTGSLFPVERFAYWGISAAFVLWSLVSLEVNAALKTPRWLQRLGDESYSIYLWHYPVMAIAFATGLEDLIPTQKLLQGILEFGVTLVVAIISYRFIERPIIRFVHGISAPRIRQIAVARM